MNLGTQLIWMIMVGMMTDKEKIAFLLNSLGQLRDNLKNTHMPLTEQMEFIDIISWMIKKCQVKDII